MLKIMFVDDEVSVLNGLTKSYDWESLGFQVVAAAVDGAQALELYYETFPDVVITDICMQDKDGLSLISELKASNPQVEIIVLSGYPDFYYAKTSIEYGVFAYLLKPLKNSDLFATLDKVKLKIAQAHNQVSEKLLFQLLQMNDPTSEFIEKLCAESNVVLPKQNYIVVGMQLDNSHSSGIYRNMCDFFFARLHKFYRVLVCQPQHHHIALLIFFENELSRTIVLNQLEHIKCDFSDQNEIEFTMGISSTFQDITLIRTAYLQALYAISQKAFYGHGSTVLYNQEATVLDENTLSIALFLKDSEKEDILNGLKTQNRPLVEKSLGTYFNRLESLRNVDVDMVKNVLGDLALQITHTMTPDSKQMKLVFGHLIFPMMEIQKMSFLTEMQEYIKYLIHQIFSQNNFLVSKNYSKTVQEIQVYIMNNYSLPISIGTIAEELHADRYQLMRVFKSETGDTINNYLINYRIRVARELLRQGTYQIQEVSINVGYQDTNYFSKLFRKHTGYLPSEYASLREE